MKRKISAYLEWWKNLGKDRMPLLLSGARQIGKTYILQEFAAENYRNTVYLNFETNPILSQLFGDSIDPHKLVPKIEMYFNTQITPGKTLLIFDEIQNCNRALTSMKYFYEIAPEYDLIGVASLLGVFISAKDYSFPVGKVISKTMYPLNFEEFMWETDKATFASAIQESYINNTPLDQDIHESMLELYREYLFVGGMPLAIYNYFSNNQILPYNSVQKTVTDTHVSDISRYTSNSQSVKTTNTYYSINSQLAKENRKFQYKLIKKGARASLFGESIDWLVRAGVVIKCDRITAGNVPPNMARDLSSFKLYMCDVGLAVCRSELTRENISYFDKTILEGLTENYVACMLASNDYELYYWSSDAQAEVDFVIMKDGKPVPIEVKAGDNVRSLSLNSYMKKYNPDYAIRISSKNFGYKNGIKSVPLYAAYLI